jgi:zinc protease
MTDRKRAVWLLVIALTAALAAAPAVAQTTDQAASKPMNDNSPIETVALPNAASPLVALRLQFNVGSIHDPAGKEGLATLTALMIGQAGTQKRSYTDLIEALYPMAASISADTDREVTVIGGTVHRDKLAEFTALLEEALLTPGFAKEDFDRNKEQLVAVLSNSLRSNDELMGLEMIQQEIFKGHPYGHSPLGTVEALKSITLDDVKKFYQDHYTQANLMLGIAGGYPNDYLARLEKDLAALPAGKKERMALPPAPKVAGRNFTLIEKQTGSVGINFGYPLPINRADADYYPLMVANSFLGEHRTFHGRLMNSLRGDRGLNYGDYSYIEYWDSPPATSTPNPNVPRREQYFSVWIRPVVPADAQFALRAGLYEVNRLREQGMTQEEFNLTRDFLINYSKLWAQSLGDRLGFHMDSRFYGMPYYIDEIEARLKKLTVQDVNAAIKKHLSTESYDAVLVTANAQQLKETLQKDEPSPKTYNSQVDAKILEADKTIQSLKVQPTKIDIVPVAEVFQK